MLSNLSCFQEILSQVKLSCLMDWWYHLFWVCDHLFSRDIKHLKDCFVLSNLALSLLNVFWEENLNRPEPVFMLKALMGVQIIPLLVSDLNCNFSIKKKNLVWLLGQTIFVWTLKELLCGNTKNFISTKGLDDIDSVSYRDAFPHNNVFMNRVQALTF